MFSSAHRVLTWAYNVSACPIVKKSGINHMRQTHASGIPNELLINLDIQERHGQAAAIILMVDNLAYKEEREYITAKFGRKLERADLSVLVYRGCQASGLGLSGQEAVYRVIKAYFEGDIPYRTVRKMLGCRHQQALMVKSCLYDVLDTIHDRAMADITEVFEQHGLIRVAAYAKQS